MMEITDENPKRKRGGSFITLCYVTYTKVLFNSIVAHKRDMSSFQNVYIIYMYHFVLIKTSEENHINVTKLYMVTIFA